MTHIFSNLIFNIELQISVTHEFQDFIFAADSQISLTKNNEFIQHIPVNITDSRISLTHSASLRILMHLDIILSVLTREYIWLTVQACKYHWLVDSYIICSADSWISLNQSDILQIIMHLNILFSAQTLEYQWHNLPTSVAGHYL